MFSTAGPSTIGARPQQPNPRARRQPPQQQPLPTSSNQQRSQSPPRQMSTSAGGGGLFGRSGIGAALQQAGVVGGGNAAQLSRELSDEQKEEIREAVREDVSCSEKKPL